MLFTKKFFVPAVLIILFLPSIKHRSRPRNGNRSTYKKKKHAKTTPPQLFPLLPVTHDGRITCDAINTVLYTHTVVRNKLTYLRLPVQAKGQRGQHDGYRGQRHGKAGQRRRQPDVKQRVKSPGCHGHAAKIVQHGEREVQPDTAENLQKMLNIPSQKTHTIQGGGREEGGRDATY